MLLVLLLFSVTAVVVWCCCPPWQLLCCVNLTTSELVIFFPNCFTHSICKYAQIITLLLGLPTEMPYLTPEFLLFVVYL